MDTLGYLATLKRKKEKEEKAQALADDNIKKIYKLEKAGPETLINVLLIILSIVFFIGTLIVGVKIGQDNILSGFTLLAFLIGFGLIIPILLFCFSAHFNVIYKNAATMALLKTTNGRLYFCKIHPNYIAAQQKFTKIGQLSANQDAIDHNLAEYKSVYNYVHSEAFDKDLEKELHRESSQSERAINLILCEDYSLVKKSFFQDTIAYKDSERNRRFILKIHHNFHIDL